MIQVRIVRSKNGMLRSCTAEGHAGFAEKGHDIVCAAVSSILRTVLALLEKTPTVRLLVNTPEPGKLFFCVQDKDKADNALLIHCGDFLQQGLGLLQDEYPEHVSLKEKTE